MLLDKEISSLLINQSAWEEGVADDDPESEETGEESGEEEPEEEEAEEEEFE